MIESDTESTCKACGSPETGNYCSHCGQSFSIKRITMKNLIKDIFYFFTNVEKGFGYTLKRLIVSPGEMQRNYMEGRRIIYQKPFSMFFICVTIAALFRLGISRLLINIYHADVIAEANFFQEYMAIMYVLLLPVFAMIAYLFFYNSGNNYAEITVLMAYALSVLFLLSSVISLSSLLWPDVDTAYLEFPIFTFYFIVTFLNYFKFYSRWEIVMKGLLVMILAFFINDVVEEQVIRLVSKH